MYIQQLTRGPQPSSLLNWCWPLKICWFDPSKSLIQSPTPDFQDDETSPQKMNEFWTPKSNGGLVFSDDFPDVNFGCIFFLGCKTFIFHGEIGFFFVQPPKQKQHGHHKQQQNFLQQPMATVGQKVFFPSKKCWNYPLAGHDWRSYFKRSKWFFVNCALAGHHWVVLFERNDVPMKR